MLLGGLQLFHTQHIHVRLVGYSPLHHVLHRLHAHAEVLLQGGVLTELFVEKENGEIYLLHTVADIIHGDIELA